MIKKLIFNDIKNNKFYSTITFLISIISAMTFALCIFLFSSLNFSVDRLMKDAKTPDFLQMHSGKVDQKDLELFRTNEPLIKEMQVCNFLSLNNTMISLGESSLADSTQDNGLSVQGDLFDFLLDTDNKIPTVNPGSVYVPVCYKSQYSFEVGDEMQIGEYKLCIQGFIRDSQMNSMMASSKRFLVNSLDYENLKDIGEEEYLIEFLLNDEKKVDFFSNLYIKNNLPANGPTVTKPLVKMMNALSDGMMIMVIFLVGIVVFTVSLICIHFIIEIQMEKDKKEIGMLKTLGINKKDIRKIYFRKFIFISGIAGILGFFIVIMVQKPLSSKMKVLYGQPSNIEIIWLLSFCSVVIIESIILLFVWKKIKKTLKISAIETIFLNEKNPKRKRLNQYLLISLVTAVSVFLMVVPNNLYSTINSPKFVTYMGIGESEIRIDIRQSSDIKKDTQNMVEQLKNDIRVKQYSVLQTVSYKAFLSNNEAFNLNVEIGDHSIFPVSYMEGHSPIEEYDIALSALSAKEMNLRIGSILELQMNSKKKEYKVCGIYSNITNGGKTAQVSSKLNITENTPVMWSIIYLSLNNSDFKATWIDEYKKAGVTVVDISEYIIGTYGQTLNQINFAKTVSTIIAISIMFIIVMLFMRLIIERERYSISLKKALGFSNRDIKRKYIISGLFYVLAGIILGIILGNFLGQNICALMLKSFGAEGFKFIILWKNVFIYIPIISIVITLVSLIFGIYEVNKVSTIECCSGKE